MPTSPSYFAIPRDFRAWLRKHHTSADELVVGFWKVASGKPSITWPESVAEALCFGWIDGVRRRIDEDSYSIRFSPRKPGSTWSAVNIRLVAELEAAGRMTPAGRAAFAARTEGKSQTYSFEQERVEFDLACLRRFKADAAAWTFFQAQPPGYRKRLTWWVVSAKKEDTRETRLKKLIHVSATGKRIT